MPNRGFFSQSEIIRLSESSGGPRCSSCGLDRGIESPRMAVTGQGRKRILVVAEAPGSESARAIVEEGIAAVERRLGS